jgi:hypothetical protein
MGRNTLELEWPCEGLTPATSPGGLQVADAAGQAAGPAAGERKDQSHHCKGLAPIPYSTHSIGHWNRGSLRRAQSMRRRGFMNFVFFNL